VPELIPSAAVSCGFLRFVAAAFGGVAPTGEIQVSRSLSPATVSSPQ
jgi:hypothetical protein